MTMLSHLHLFRSSGVHARAFAGALLLATSPTWALYKVVGADGKVSYTDRPPAGQNSQQVQTVAGGSSPLTNGLPYAMVSVVSRFPVTLYTFKPCSVCDQGRNYLKQRGVPFTEKSVNSNTELTALEQLTGSRQLPLLRIGKQQINGYSASEWGSYLDVAGYPATSALPKDYRWPDATPLVATAEPPRTTDKATSAQPGAASPAPRAVSPSGNAAGIRF